MVCCGGHSLCGLGLHHRRHASCSRARPGGPFFSLSEQAILLTAGLSRLQLPHRAFWKELAGLVRDGVSFFAHGGNLAAGAGGEKSSATSVTGLKTGLLAEGSSKDQATRGTATPLHIAAQLGDARGLKNLLQGDTRFRPPIDAGDARRYTALHCACAGMKGWRAHLFLHRSHCLRWFYWPQLVLCHAGAQ